MKYEVIREIFNQCSNNQMRDVFVSRIETDSPDEVVRSYCVGSSFSIDKTMQADGTIVFDFVVDGLRQRMSFTPDD